MPVEIPSPDDVVDFPKDNPRLKIVRHKETLYEVICDGDECRFAEVTKRQHEIATRMGCPDLYAVVPNGFSNPH